MYLFIYLMLLYFILESLKRYEKFVYDVVKSYFCKVCERGFFRKEYLNCYM